MFTVVNDDVYDYANLIDGMVLDEANSLGTDITRYTGSTTGDHFDSTLEGERCDDVGPVTWHVDRTCRLISTWSMDQMCLGIKNRARMKRCGSVCDHMPPNAIDADGCCFPDTKPHGSRDVVVDDLAANNQVWNEFGNEIPALVY